MTAAPDIPGAREVAERLGSWPSFHDAEVVELSLRRGAPSLLVLLLADHAERGRRSRVVFALERVTGLELCEFNEQNVVFQLDVEPAGPEAVRLRLAPCYGLNGWIEATGVQVRIAPQPPPAP